MASNGEVRRVVTVLYEDGRSVRWWWVDTVAEWHVHEGELVEVTFCGNGMRVTVPVAGVKRIELTERWDRVE